MSLTKLLIGQILVVLAIGVAGVWTATRWCAAMLSYQPQLGQVWFHFLGLGQRRAAMTGSTSSVSRTLGWPTSSIPRNRAKMTVAASSNVMPRSNHRSNTLVSSSSPTPPNPNATTPESARTSAPWTVSAPRSPAALP